MTIEDLQKALTVLIEGGLPKETLVFIPYEIQGTIDNIYHASPELEVFKIASKDIEIEDSEGLEELGEFEEMTVLVIHPVDINYYDTLDNDTSQLN